MCIIMQMILIYMCVCVCSVRNSILFVSLLETLAFVIIAVFIVKNNGYLCCFRCRNLFQQQLMSLDNDDIDVNQPIVRRPDILPRGIRQSPDGVIGPDYSSLVDDDASMQLAFDGGDASVFQSVAVLGTAVVVCGFGMQFCRRRTKRRRKHARVMPVPAARRSRIAR